MNNKLLVYKREIDRYDGHSQINMMVIKGHWRKTYYRVYMR